MLLLKNFWLFLLWMGIILFLSFTPVKDWSQPTVFQKLYIDKVIHITMYAVLSFLLLRSLSRQQKNQSLRYTTIAYSLLFSAGVGISIEILQPVLTMYRQFEWLDMAANAAGATMGWFVYKWIAMKGWLGLRVISRQ